METLKKRPITDLKGVGPKIAALLAKLGIYTYLDLLFYLPYRYQDRTKITPIADLTPGEIAIIEGQVVKKEFKRGRRATLVLWLQDDSGLTAVRFFHYNAGMVKRFDELKVLRCYGEVRFGFNRLEMSHPEILNFAKKEAPLEERLTPIYSLTAGLSQRQIQGFINTLLADLSDEYFPSYLTPTPKNLREALYFLHKPPIEVDIPKLEAKQYKAQTLMALEEIVAHQVALRRSRLEYQKKLAFPIHLKKTTHQQFLANLPFTLTTAQLRVIDEIEHDLQSKQPMMRLVQGDVGSGKTVVAAIALIHAALAGFQAVFIAPTELLAEQHARNLAKWFTPFKLPALLLTGKLTEKQKKEAYKKIAASEVKIIIGTHAVFQDMVIYHDLNLVVIDEQHRFGVEQRQRLQQKAKKGFTPHQLMMTATPIPRTLAMTAYADLDSSIIDELPPDRIPITTTLVSQKKRDAIIERLRLQCEKGIQAYWVCTLIEESEVLPAKAAEKTYQYLQEKLPQLSIGLIHGRQKAQEKEAIMAQFKNHGLDILVATTVIEVGVDVPNASIMVIENAERLGLSQLHQLRGRVGRGSQASYCLLLYSSPLSNLTKERLAIMAQTTNGFTIAEKDYELRGAGDIFGTRQTGLLEFRIADLTKQSALVEEANRLTQQIITDEVLCQKLIERWIGERQTFIYS